MKDKKRIRDSATLLRHKLKFLHKLILLFKFLMIYRLRIKFQNLRDDTPLPTDHNDTLTTNTDLSIFIWFLSKSFFFQTVKESLQVCDRFSSVPSKGSILFLSYYFPRTREMDD